MNMQQMIIQAQKMQRELQKKQAELQQKEFTISKGGAVTVVVKGDKTIQSFLCFQDLMHLYQYQLIE